MDGTAGTARRGTRARPPLSLSPPRAARRRLLVVALGVVLAGGLLGCSGRMKKLSSGGNVAEVLLYDVLGQDRSPAYYYQLVRDSHDEETFCYRCGDDPYIVDKNIDAILRLGDAPYGRLEGQAEVVELLTEILNEDRSALARSAAATSLTKIGVRLPRYGTPRVLDRGDRFLTYAQRLDGLYTSGRVASDAAAREEVRRVLEQIGALEFEDLLTTKNAVKLFYGRPYLVDETDPVLRRAIDTALTRRMAALIRMSLTAAVEDPVPQVRADAIRGLKTMGDRSAVEAVIVRLDYESDWIVQMEAVEYLGRVGGREAVATLVPMLEDGSASVRHKARAALTRIAGHDHGWRRSAWEAWARSLDPGIRFADAEDEEAAEEDAGPAVAGRAR